MALAHRPSTQPTQFPSQTPTLLLLALPPQILCGINLLSFTTTKKFHGIKDLPPGFHFLFTSETTSLTLRSGFWFYVPPTSPSAPAPLIVRNWDTATNSLIPCSESAEDYRDKVTELWERGLSPYRQSTGQPGEEDKEGIWGTLTAHITSGILSHLLNKEWSISSASCTPEDRDEIPGLSAGETGFEERELGSLGIDLRRTWREGAVGRERTEGARDASSKLEEVVERWAYLCDGGAGEGEWGNTVLGQMEACFLMVLTVANYSCLEEWKRCVGLVLGCRRAVREREGFFERFLGVVRRLLERGEDVEGGFFEAGDEEGGLLRSWLRGFKRGLGEVLGEGEGEGVKEEMEELEKTLKTLYGWEMGDDFVRQGMLDLEDGERVEMDVENTGEGDESGEYAPVVVDLDTP